MAVTIEDIYGPARLACPGVVAANLELELYSVLDEFFTDTAVWVEEVDFDTEDEVKEYTIIPTDGVIIRLMNCVNSDETPVSARFALPDTLILGFEPSSVETLTANVALKPLTTEDIDRCAPEWVYSMYSDALADGLKARLMVQPAKPYTNAALAAYHHRKFRNVVNTVKNEVLQRYTFRSQGWQFPRFGR